MKFRRQHILGDKYIADFFCADLKLVIEVDGGIHLSKDVAENDQQRTELLKAWGYNILRFSNLQIETNIEEVLLTIASYARF